MCMEKLYAKHEVPVINVVSGINLHVKLHQVIFFMATNFISLVTILKVYESHQKETFKKIELGALKCSNYLKIVN